MANPSTSLPLYERVARKNTIARAIELGILSLLLSLLTYRILSFQDHGFSWLLAFLCESWFAFIWVLTVSAKWSQVEYQTYPQRVSERKLELPPVDMFVTTADPVLEPPILTVNTVLSLLALDYPADKLACYVSDDGGSPLTFYSLVEASKFAKLWVPFCKKYSIQVRAPFRYFSGESMPSQDISPQFRQDWKKMKDEYEKLSQKIEDAAKGSIPCELTGEFAGFLNIQRKNHASIVKVIWENKEAGNANGAVPHLVYISREKRPKHPHHFKAGAMNVLYIGRGLAGIQGPFYGGTGCFHRRKVIYGLSPFDEEISGKLSDENLRKTFGSSMEFIKSAAQILSGSKSTSNSPHDLLSSVEAANQAAACVYEYGTAWGREMGWIYGSTTEDVLTGLTIQGRGWKSTYCTPTPPGFLGCAPSGGPATMTQQKRWATGLLEILVGRRSPLILTLRGKLQFRQCLAYLWNLLWGLRSVPELCYATLPAYCIISGSRFLPKVGEPALLIPVAIFITYNLYTLSEYLRAGLSARAWWNNQRMWRITAMTAWLFGVFSVVLKLLGLSETVFEVTQKEQSSTNGSDDDNADVGRFTFNESPIFIPATTVLLVNLTALVIAILGFRPAARGGDGSGIGEVIFSSCVVLCLWAFLKGLCGKGKYGIPLATVYKSGALALLFVNLSRWTSMG
ncbi:cellulose synthase-like protein B4 isoform X2 [Rhododendron vialii]|uniref:cellulose synthase-like protein B4 isoform X2 n=1 Tax=Rhododendron vialii TaxID=182163 RepID=UPI00265E64D9|nr:cellulose synthase-like protein B4 isoform X2 [Rhododendron vialii]